MTHKYVERFSSPNVNKMTRQKRSLQKRRKSASFSLWASRISLSAKLLCMCSAQTLAHSQFMPLAHTLARRKAPSLSSCFSRTTLETVILRPAAQKYVSIIPFCTLLMESARRLLTSRRIVFSSDILWALHTILLVLLSTSLWARRSNHCVCSLTAVYSCGSGWHVACPVTLKL